MEASEHIITVQSVHAEARKRGLFFQQLDSAPLRGRSVEIAGRPLVSFASCSYLGLEHHPKLVSAVHEAVDRYGTQFSASRGYLSAPEYTRLEDLLGEIFEGHVLVTPSTTLGHAAALPVLVTERDAIVMDHQVHHSVQTAATLARAGGARVEIVRHGQLERAEELVRRLSGRHRTVWFACDGVYSMYGDLAPAQLLARLLDVAPNVHLYVDDAHGMSWAGKHGRGSFLSRFGSSPRLVLATSLNKAFSAGGGCLVFPQRDQRELVRTCACPMVFSGPLQPPMLGAALASAHVHLSPEIVERQQVLADHVAHANQVLTAAEIPLLAESDSPIFFIGLGLPSVAFDVAERLLASGNYVCASAYPSVPMDRAGIRLTLTAGHSRAEIDRALGLLIDHVREVLRERGTSLGEIAHEFAEAIPREARRRAHVSGAGLLAGQPTPTPIPAPVRPRVRRSAVLSCCVHTSIDDIDPGLWNRLMGTRGLVAHGTMRALESVFLDHPKPEHRWGFQYVIIRDAAEQPVLATLFTTALIKDDMLMQAEVSSAVEARRVADPYFLTSRAVMMGSMLSEGRHLYVDRTAAWPEAMELALDVAYSQCDASNASALLLRDLPADDPEMDALLFEHGLLKAPMLGSHILAVDPNPEHYAASLGRRKRMYLRQYATQAEQYIVRVHDPRDRLDPTTVAHLHGLYLNVARKSRRLNVFHLPEDLFARLFAEPDWELVTLYIPTVAGGPTDGRPVAFFAAYHHGPVYAGFLCGLDYSYVLSHGAYRQVLYQALLRARAVGAEELRLGMGADVEKARFGTEVQRNVVYVHARDDFGGTVLRDIAERGRLGAPG